MTAEAQDVRGSGILVTGTGQTARRLASALSAIDTGEVAAACVIPELPEEQEVSALSDERMTTAIADVLAGILATVQGVLPRLRNASSGGRLVFVLPHGPVMGQPYSVAAAAVAGGVLSMARTLAIELSRAGITVNALMVGDEGNDAALAHQVEALLARESSAITGQEIYVTGGRGLGRLRP